MADDKKQTSNEKSRSKSFMSRIASAMKRGYTPPKRIEARTSGDVALGSIISGTAIITSDAPGTLADQLAKIPVVQIRSESFVSHSLASIMGDDVESTGIEAVDKELAKQRKNTVAAISRAYGWMREGVLEVQKAVQITDENVQRVFEDQTKFKHKTTSAIEELQRDIQNLKVRQQTGGNELPPPLTTGVTPVQTEETEKAGLMESLIALGVGAAALGGLVWLLKNWEDVEATVKWVYNNGKKLVDFANKPLPERTAIASQATNDVLNKLGLGLDPKEFAEKQKEHDERLKRLEESQNKKADAERKRKIESEEVWNTGDFATRSGDSITDDFFGNTLEWFMFRSRPELRDFQQDQKSRSDKLWGNATPSLEGTGKRTIQNALPFGLGYAVPLAKDAMSWAFGGTAAQASESDATVSQQKVSTVTDLPVLENPYKFNEAGSGTAAQAKPPQLADADIPIPSLGTKPPTEIQSSVKPEREIKPVVGFSSSPNIGNITNVLTGRQQFPQAGTPSISSKEFWNQSQTEEAESRKPGWAAEYLKNRIDPLAEQHQTEAAMREMMTRSQQQQQEMSWAELNVYLNSKVYGE
jgi:hypothetical protein